MKFFPLQVMGVWEEALPTQVKRLLRNEILIELQSCILKPLIKQSLQGCFQQGND